MGRRIMYLSKKLEWLLPYINDIKPLFPKIRRVKKISHMRTNTSQRNRAEAEIRPLDNEYFNIAIRSQYQYITFSPFSVVLKDYSKVDTLIALAHEFSHLYHWTHTPEHKILEIQILSMFMLRLKGEGYIDEETEVGEENV